jgi:hypothetical protein
MTPHPMTARLRKYKEHVVKLIPVPARPAARASLLTCALAAASLYTFTPAGHVQAASGTAGLRASGLWHTSKKTVVNMRDLAAAEGKAVGGHPSTGPAATTAIRSALGPVTTTALADAPAASAPTVAANFPGLTYNGIRPPDPSAAASPAQIVEVVNRSLQVYTRDGARGAGCPTVSLDDFFGKLPSEKLTDPRVIYDNVSGKFTVVMSVITTPPTGPHLPVVNLLRMAHTTTGDACGPWIEYSLEAEVSTSGIPEGTFIDQPAVGQDRNAFLFGGANYTNDTPTLLSYVAFSYPKICAYDPHCTTDFQVFRPAHYATPASSGGSPMITTAHSYFIASVPGTGYELYRMDNSGDTNATIFTLQAVVGSGQLVEPPTRDAGQPGTSNLVNLDAGHPLISTRITSAPTYDGSRIWFAHGVTVSNHPAVRYGAIDPAANTVATALAFHSASSDDFNPSIAVGLNGTARTIFLNWAYTDVAAGIPVTDTVATVTIASADSPPPVNGKDVKLITGGITNDNRFGDYSSVVVDPASPGQVCAVTAQEYFDPATNGQWATRISRFGAAGC